MIDLHSHLLPDIDDGSRSTKQSVEVLAAFVGAGITDVGVTPHIRASETVTDGEERIEQRDWTLEELRAAAPDGIQLHPGFEIMLDQPMPPVAVGDRRFALAGSRYYLVEFPFAIVGDLATGILARIAAAGVIPVVAHPERYSACDTEIVGQWREAGARIQVDSTTLVRPTARGERARSLVALGFADFLAADNHGDPRTMKIGADFLAERGGQEVVSLLTEENPRAVLEDREMSPVPPVQLKRRLSEKFKRWLSS